MSNSSTIRSIALPDGGKLLASATLKGQPAECSAAANLQMQIAPWLASMSCQFHILKLLKPLIDIVSALPNPSARALQEFSKAAEDLAPCLLAQSPPNLLPFVRDLLCLQIQSLTCLRRQLELMGTVESSGALAPADVQIVLDSYQPIVGLVNLAGGLFNAIGTGIPQAPALAAGTDASSLAADQAILADFIAALQEAADALGGC